MAISRGRQLLALVAFYAAYLDIRNRILARAEKAGTRIGPRWLGLFAWNLLHGWSRLMGVRLASENSFDHLDPSKRYLIVWHPHGFIAWSALFIVSRMAIMGHPHGREWFAMVAPALFRLPIFSEALMLVNARRVDKDIVENLAVKDRCMAIQPGGVKEQLITRHDQEQAVFPKNLGFLRIAIRHGMDILPVYVFNENQLYKRVAGFDRVSELVFKLTGLAVPVATAKMGLPVAGLLPRSAEIHVRWGEPLAVGPPEPEPSDERVEALFVEYVTRLQRIFDLHAKDCLPPEVAAKGLRILRAGEGSVPLTEVSVADLRKASGSPEARL
mmetsp:Transcript_33644/g.73622  ORF Transcript_33644/g.73622 Transcript_33644/m.73622 type:complete len:328 (-) Transcript_33644:115-1098(-)